MMIIIIWIEFLILQPLPLFFLGFSCSDLHTFKENLGWLLLMQGCFSNRFMDTRPTSVPPPLSYIIAVMEFSVVRDSWLPPTVVRGLYRWQNKAVWCMDRLRHAGTPTQWITHVLKGKGKGAGKIETDCMKYFLLQFHFRLQKSCLLRDISSCVDFFECEDL